MSRAPDPRALPAFVSDERGKAILAIMTRVTGSFDWRRDLALRVEDIPAQMLPYAIRSLGVQDYVAPGMQETYLRRVVANALPIKLQEGSIKGVRYALGLLGMTVQWTQWHEMTPLGAPGTHKAVITLEERLFDGEPVLSERSMRQARRVIETVKRHSQDVAISVSAEAAMGVRMAAVGVRPMAFAFLNGSLA